MSLRAQLVAQFKKPSGALGALAGWVMSTRPSNVARNKWTIDLLDIQPSDAVLEIGCGPGVALAQAATIAHAGEVVGIDYSPVMVRQASRRLKGAIREGRAAVLCMSAMEARALGRSFDKIYSANVAQFFADPVATFGVLRSLLRPGGRIASTFQPRNKGAGQEDALRAAERLAASLTAAGFADVRREWLDLKPVPAVCVLAS